LPSSDTMTPPASHAQQLEFPDNRLLIDLCGPYDANLTAVETALEVQIVRRGNHLSVMGEEDATTRAASNATAKTSYCKLSAVAPLRVIIKNHWPKRRLNISSKDSARRKCPTPALPAVQY